MLGSSDETVRVWDMTTGEQLQTLEGHSGDVRSVAFSSDGRRIVSGIGDTTVRVCDVANGKQLHTMEGHSGAVTLVAFSRDGRSIVSSSADKTVRVWSEQTLGQVISLTYISPTVSLALEFPLVLSEHASRMLSPAQTRTSESVMTKHLALMHRQPRAIPLQHRGQVIVMSLLQSKTSMQRPLTSSRAKWTLRLMSLGQIGLCHCL